MLSSETFVSCHTSRTALAALLVALIAGCPIGTTPDDGSLDSDSDGVANRDDACPDTPEGVLLTDDGCPGAWTTQADPLLGIPVAYELRSDGTLIRARPQVSDDFISAILASGCIGADDDGPDVSEFESTILTDTVAAGTPTVIVTGEIVGDELTPPGSFSITVEYRAFELTVASDGTVTWTFDVIASVEIGVGDDTLARTEGGYQGTLSGTIDTDGTVVTWTEVEGTLTCSTFFSTQLIDTTEQDLALAGTDTDETYLIGSEDWTLEPAPDPTPDSDSDGVGDPFDLCPDTPADDEADLTGCSAEQRDTDEDGVVDAADECEDTPADETPDAAGCSPSQLDGDADGVSDADDLCPDTPAGEEVDVDGCTVPAGGPVAAVWQAAGDPFIIYGITLAQFELSVDGTLVQAVFDFDVEDEPTLDVEVVADTVPYRVETVVIVFDAGEEFGVTELRLRYDEYVLTVGEDGTAELAFDLTASNGGTVLGLEFEQTERWEGTQSGTVSEDGTTITWTALSGSYTIEDSLTNMPVTEPLEQVYSVDGLVPWTLVEETDTP